MLDINLIREKPDWVVEQIETLGDSAPIKEILDLDTKRRQIRLREEELRRQRNVASKDVGRLMGARKKIQKEIDHYASQHADDKNQMSYKKN